MTNIFSLNVVLSPGEQYEPQVSPDKNEKVVCARVMMLFLLCNI